MLSISDTICMDVSHESRIGEDPGPQDQPLKKQKAAFKEGPNSEKQKSEDKAAEDTSEEAALAADEEPGTFDRVYEHGRQMGF
jgi:hypothetical protein